MYNARQNNAGWRIDYFLVSDRLREAVYGTPIHSSILGSDHCPVELDLEISCNGSIWQSEPAGKGTVRQTESKPMNGTVKKTLLGAAVCLLALGFAAGFFTNRSLANPDDTALHTPVADGAITAEEARQMTTLELIRNAVQIPDLKSRFALASSCTVQDSIYETLKQEYPVLAELETREDAAEQLQIFSLSISSLDRVDAALTLLGLPAYGGPPDGEEWPGIDLDDIVIGDFLPGFVFTEPAWE